MKEDYAKKRCVLAEKCCDACGECDCCDLDTQKRCDSCGRCLNLPGGDYFCIEIDHIAANKPKTD